MLANEFLDYVSSHWDDSRVDRIGKYLNLTVCSLQLLPLKYLELSPFGSDHAPPFARSCLGFARAPLALDLRNGCSPRLHRADAPVDDLLQGARLLPQLLSK